MLATQITTGRFHHFHLARQLQKRGLLDCIWSAYPKWKLNNESGIPRYKIRTFPWVQSIQLAARLCGADSSGVSVREFSWYARETLDWRASLAVKRKGVLIGMSGSGLRSGRVMQSRFGGKYICDRGSTHIKAQEKLLDEEYRRWGLRFGGTDPRVIRKEIEEYEQADLITVPTSFVTQTFVEYGVPKNKIRKVPYGADLSRFNRVAEPDPNTFCVLWVGAVGFRKGFLDALEGFNILSHPRKRFLVIGNVESDISPLLRKWNLHGVEFLGRIPNAELPMYYSRAHVFVLPSIEEGLAMVQGEALACGCPIVATPNAGGDDLFENGKEGFIVPTASPKLIAEKLLMLADDKHLRESMAVAAVRRVQLLRGWNQYGSLMVSVLRELFGEEL